MKMNKIERIVFLAIMIIACVCDCHAYSFEKDGIFYTIGPGSYYVAVTYKTTDGNSYSGDVVIPETVTYQGKEYPVMYISQQAFYMSSSLTSVSIPESVISIGQKAFSGCTSLRTVNIPSNITAIAAYTFDNCYSLQTVDGIDEAYIHDIYGYAFRGCSSLKSLPLPSTVTTVGPYAYYNACTADVTNINLPDNIVEIGQYAFNGIQVRSIYIPKSLEELGENAFSHQNCTSLKVDSNNKLYDSRDNCNAIIETWSNRLILGCVNTVIPDGVETIGEYAFNGCTNLVSIVIPASVKRIQCGAFFNCIGLKNVDIKGDITELEDASFYKAEISELSLPSSLKKIGNEALHFNMDDIVLPDSVYYLAPVCITSRHDVNSITLPASVTYMSAGALTIYGELKELRCKGDIPFYTNDYAFRSLSTNDVTLVVKGKYLSNYQNTYPWSEFTNIELWKDVEAVNFSTSSLEMTKGETSVIRAYVSPSDATLSTLVWSSSDESVATVDNGYVKAISEGQAVITAKTTDGTEVFNSCLVTVNEEVYNIASLALTDGETFSSDKYQMASSLTYTRQFNNTKWQALYVPFSISYDDWKDDFTVSKINAVRMYDTDNDDEYDLTEVEIVKVKSGTLYPNHPYFIKANSTGSKTISLSDVLVYPSRVDSITCSTTETSYIFKGTYDVVTGTEMLANKYYALSGGAFCYTTSDDANLNPFRWYLKVTQKGTQVITQSSANVRIRTAYISDDGEVTYDEYEATGLDNLTIDENTDNRIFSLDGRLISTDGETNSLKPGIYIKNNAKYIVR